MLPTLNSLADAKFHCSVVAVTGLNGHSWGSWRGREKAGRMWLRDYFRQDFPHLRTMTYGYNSKLQARNVDTILDYGLTNVPRGDQELLCWIVRKAKDLASGSCISHSATI
jgi:hypothetical protein